MTITLLAVMLVLGLGTGFAAGLLGIGGGSIIVPLLTIIFSIAGFSSDLVVHMAVATSLGTIFFTSMSSVYAHNKKRAIYWRVAMLLVPGVVVGSWIGPMIAARLNTSFLAGFFGLFIIFSAIKMLKKKKTPAGAGATEVQLPGRGAMSAAGLGIGVLSGLVGAGGGFITVPFLNWRGMNIHNAVATSAVMGFPIALFGALSNIYEGWGVADLPSASLGFIYLPALACIAIPSVFCAPIGARTAHKLKVGQLRTTFAYLLLVLALYMFWKAVTA